MKINIKPATYRRITFWTIVALGAIVLTGVSVRLTGSGLGCPDWPNCDDRQFVPTGEYQYHAWIEFGNRLVTGVVSVAVVLAVLGSLWRVPKRNDLVWWSLGLVAGVGAQVILGRWVVTSELKPWVVIAHFLLSMVLLWNAIVLHHRADDKRFGSLPIARKGLNFRNSLHASSDSLPSQRTSPQSDLGLPTLRLGDSRLRAMLWVMSVLAGWVLVNGTLVTGSGPHGGDENAERLSFDIADVARLHSISVIVFCVLVLGIFWMLFRSGLRLPEEELKPMYVLMVVIAMQGFIGYLQYFNDVPELLVGLHVLGAISVWWATLHAHLAVWNAHLEQQGQALPGSERHRESQRS